MVSCHFMRDVKYCGLIAVVNALSPWKPGKRRQERGNRPAFHVHLLNLSSFLRSPLTWFLLTISLCMLQPVPLPIMELSITDAGLSVVVHEGPGNKGKKNEYVWRNGALIPRFEEVKQHSGKTEVDQAQSKKRSQTDVENEELRQLTHYLSEKISSLEKTIDRLADGDEVKVVFLGHDDALEAIQHKYVVRFPYLES